tara:strand:+ start:4233 stop:4634 length:402 start_codon:yes stop_codon:yes gene_type:complete
MESEPQPAQADDLSMGGQVAALAMERDAAWNAAIEEAAKACNVEEAETMTCPDCDRAPMDCECEPLPRWRHVQRGTEYTEIGRGEIQMSTRYLNDGEEIVIYRGADGLLWARGTLEFEDGRFVRVETTSSETR